ncbi:MAG: ribosomal protein S18-alanine N-acetyltransferase [Fimbriimonadaceae bacterium]|nr:ribosomal protein S18-alanine N-acetyltransferase [Fimbriimonadaceae bacterium]
MGVDLPGFRIATLEERHIPAILEIEKQSQSAPWSEQSFKNELSQPHSIFLVATSSQGLVGYGGVWILADESHVTTVAVDPTHRRKGIARILMIELLERSKERLATCSTLEVRKGNEGAIRLYEDLGYVTAGIRKGYYPDNKEDAVIMWLHDLTKWSPPT